MSTEVLLDALETADPQALRALRADMRKAADLMGEHETHVP